jgi:hypothetical protein
MLPRGGAAEWRAKRLLSQLWIYNSLSKSEAYSIIHKYHVVDLLKGDRLEIFGKRRKPKKGYLGFRELKKW